MLDRAGLLALLCPAVSDPVRPVPDSRAARRRGVLVAVNFDQGQPLLVWEKCLVFLR